MTRSRRPFDVMMRTVLCAAAAGGLAACSASFHASVSLGGTKTVDNPDTLVSSGLQKVTGTAPEGVSCPSDVPAKVGHVFKCDVTINSTGDYVVATVTEQSIKGKTVNVHISDSKSIYKP